jgi:beta-glucosidase-like glycosyl hydrolase
MSLKRYLTKIALASGLALLIGNGACERNESNAPLYLDASQPVEIRVEDLLARMTLEEKIGQMNMPCVYAAELGGKYYRKNGRLKLDSLEHKFDACRRFTEGTYEKEIGPGGGFFTLANTILHKGPGQQADFFNELQKIAVEKTRLKIPLIQFEEGTHGLMCSGGTIFPEGLALGSTWNMNLVEEIYSVAAKEARAIGVHQLFTLVVEPNRDPRLGRNIEGYSEDPYLCSRLAEVIVEGTQGEDISAPDKVVAGLCHYPGQSEPVSGLEQGAMEISERKLRTVFLPPWEAGIKKCGALGVMATYPAIDDVPAHGSEKIMTGILRDELGFEGLVLGEGGGLTTTVVRHVAEDQKKAGELAVKAGVDVGITYEEAYMRPLLENVREGRVSVEMIDRSVRRILGIKFRQGLFENPYVDPEHAVRVSHTTEHRELALQAARESIVLLKNENNLLPLDRSKINTIAVIGPNADNGRNQLGDYTSRTILQDIVTVLDGIKNKVSPTTKVVHVKGCNVLRTDLDEISLAADAAAGADVAVVVLGENERHAIDAEGNRVGTNGEGKDVASLDLTGLQEKLVRAVYATGTPTVVVLINGRPLSTRWIAEHVPAIIEPWMCGEEGGNAVAEVLFGDYNPSGRLPITVPRHVGQLPVYYNYKPSKAWNIANRGYVDMSCQPLFEFGHGLSYTSFEYSNLRISPAQTGPDGDVAVSVDVTNTGGREGAEVVQLYINDVISSLVTPVKELKGFDKVNLQPGQKQTVTFKLTPYDLSFIDTNMERIVEPGTFEIMVGGSSEKILLNGSFEVR